MALIDARKREARNQTLTQFRRLQKAMPSLIDRMKQDLTDDPNVRVFATMKEASPQDHFLYVEEEFGDLGGKLLLLEQAGMIHRMHEVNAPVYVITQEFVDLVLSE